MKRGVTVAEEAVFGVATEMRDTLSRSEACDLASSAIRREDGAFDFLSG